MVGTTGIIATPGFIRDSAFSTEENVQLVGQNTGNLVFHYAANKLVRGKKVFAWPSFDGYESAKLADTVIFSAANHLRIGSISEEFMDYLESFQRGVAVVGLGVQSPLGVAPEDILKQLMADPVQRRFLRWLGNLENKIGVRGNIAGQVLALAGVQSRLTGCPSLFLNNSRTLGQTIHQSFQSLAKTLAADPAEANDIADCRPKVAVTAAATWEIFNSGDAQLTQVERRLFRLALDSDGSYLQQSGGADLIDISLGRFAGVSESAISSVAQILGWTAGESEFRANFPRVSKVFFDAQPWMEYVAEHDLSIGTRLHGNMLAIAAGVPAIFIPHDSRTQELIEAMKVPWVSLKDISEHSTLLEIIGAVRFDPNEFDKNRSKLAANLEAVSPMRPDFAEGN